MSYPLVRDLAAEGIPVRLTCGVLGHSTQAYYAWLAAPVSRRDLEDAHVTNALIDAHADDPEFGYRFLADEVAGVGLVAGERRVWRLCSQQKLWSTTCARGGQARARRPARRCTTTTCSGTSPPAGPTRSGSPTSSATRRS